LSFSQKFLFKVATFSMRRLGNRKAYQKKKKKVGVVVKKKLVITSLGKNQ
jgi:hypothetical protein